MFQVYETVSGRRRCVTGSVNIAMSFMETLINRGIRCFIVCE